MLFSKDIHKPTVLRSRQKLCTLISLSYLTLEDPRLLSHTCLVFPHTRLLKGIRYVRVSILIWQLNLTKKVLFCLLQKELNVGSIILLQPLAKKVTKWGGIDLNVFLWINIRKPTKWKKNPNCGKHPLKVNFRNLLPYSFSYTHTWHQKTLRTLNRMSAQLKNLGLKAISQIPFTVKCGSRLYFLSVRRTMMVSPK